MEKGKTQTIDLQHHKVYIEDLKTEMVPYSVAVKAVEQMAELQAKEYMEDLEYAMKDLHKTINQIQKT